MFINIDCFAQKATLKIEFILVSDDPNYDIEPEIRTADSTQFKNYLHNLLDNRNSYKMGEAYLSEINSNFYMRIFNHRVFGYNEVSVITKRFVINWEMDLSIQVSTDQNVSFQSYPIQQFVCHLDSLYAFNLKINASHKMLAIVTPTMVIPAVEQQKLKREPLQQWIRIVAVTHQIDTSLTRHIPGDPALMAFCEESDISDCKATMHQAIMLINEGDTYLIIRSHKIKQKVNKPLTWVRGWDKCKLTLEKGKVERFRFADHGKIMVMENKGFVLETKDRLNCDIEIENEY
jgi:hypothetical protein